MPDPVPGDTLAAFEEARDMIEATLFDWLMRFEERQEGEPEGPSAHHLAVNTAKQFRGETSRTVVRADPPAALLGRPFRAVRSLRPPAL